MAPANRLLLITYYFPPIGGIGVARALSLAKYLPQHDFDVHVLTAGNTSSVGQDEGLLRQVPASVHVHRVPTIDLPFGMRKALKQSMGCVKKPAALPAKSGAIARLRNVAVQFVKDRFVPDPQVVWVPRATRYARELIKREGIDTVLITVPTYSLLLIGERLKREFPKLTLVSDYRDEWLSYYFDELGFNRSDYARREAARIERTSVELSDLVVAATDVAAHEMSRRYPEFASKFFVITNGYDTTATSVVRGEAQQSNSAKTLITHVGSIYKPSDPTALMQALGRLSQDIRRQLHIRMIGRVEEAGFRELLESEPEIVELIPFMPQHEAFQRTRETDYVLIMSNDRINIQGKLYEYLGMHKPILGITHPDSPARRLLDETKAAWCADCDDVPAIIDLLVKACRMKPQLAQEHRPDATAIAKYDRANLAAEYARLIRSVGGDAAASHVKATGAGA